MRSLMQRNYLAIDLRGYPSPLFEKVCQVVSLQDFSKSEKSLTGVEIETPFQLKRVPKADLIFAKGGTVKKNRRFLSYTKIDVLSHPYPFDSVQARLAAANKTALELCFREIESTSGYIRARILNNLRKTIITAKKYHAPLIITSGASSPMMVKSPRTLVAFGKILGLDYPEAKACIYTIPKMVLEGVE